MQCKELEAVLELEGLTPLPAAARAHLAGCASCQDFLVDLSAIVAAANELPADIDPPEHLWISLRAQLQAEGVIREAVASPILTPAWQGWRNLGLWFRPRALATAGVGLVLVVTAVFLSLRPISQTPGKVAPIARLENPVTPAPVLAPAPHSDPKEDLRMTEGQLADFHLAGGSPADVSLQQSLHTVNEFIAECELHLKKYPDDELAREYLNSALQQKAELLTAMMDIGRSEH